jgi:hypothetical protein
LVWIGAVFILVIELSCSIIAEIQTINKTVAPNTYANVPTCFQYKNLARQRPAQTQDAAHPQSNFLQVHYRKYQTRVESLSEIIDKLGRNRLVPRDKELKIMRLVCDNGVLKLMPRRLVVACDAEGGL